MGKKKLHLGIDLGGDTIKIAYATEKGGKVVYGKITEKGFSSQTAIPALAYYDEQNTKWYFGNELNQYGFESFITVVKIKNLLSLLTKPSKPVIKPTDDGSPIPVAKKKEAKREWQKRLAEWESNVNYYNAESHFPKFFFPVEKAFLSNYKQMVDDEMTFVASGFTPKKICEEFFKYINKIVESRKAELESELGFEISGYEITLVHPAKTCDEFLEECSRLIKLVFGVAPFKVLSSNKALALYAQHRGDVKSGDSFLVFDMGEESLSVVQASLFGDQVAIDGVEGHSEPIEIGGNDIDRAIVNFLEEKIADRETAGTPSAGSRGHLVEGSVYSKRYLLMKEVKRAKVIFSKPIKKGSIFESGVPVTFRCELDVTCEITKEEVEKCIGVKRGNGIACKIVDYIFHELTLPINKRVKKIFLSGGLVETYSLLDFIKAELAQEKRKVEVISFDDGNLRGSEFTILSHEDSVFAPSVGGAIVGYKNITINTVLSLSYGTWAMGRYVPATDRDLTFTKEGKYLSIFANRGDVIGPNGTKFLTKNPFTLGGSGVTREEMFSLLDTNAEIEAACSDPKNYTDTAWEYCETSEGKHLVIGNPQDEKRKVLMKTVGLTRVAGGEKSRIYMMYRDKYLRLKNDKDKISIKEGVFFDKNGVAKPIIENVTAKADLVPVYLYNTLEEVDRGGQDALPQQVSLKDIQVFFSGLEDFTT